MKDKPTKVNLTVNWVYNDNKIDNQAEYYFYNKTYNLDKPRKELPFCIVSPFKNFFSKGSGISYLKSAENMNYSNYQVLLADDLSTDHSTSRILDLVR